MKFVTYVFFVCSLLCQGHATSAHEAVVKPGKVLIVGAYPYEQSVRGSDNYPGRPSLITDSSIEFLDRMPRFSDRESIADIFTEGEETAATLLSTARKGLSVDEAKVELARRLHNVDFNKMEELIPFAQEHEGQFAAIIFDGAVAKFFNRSPQTYDIIGAEAYPPFFKLLQPGGVFCMPLDESLPRMPKDLQKFESMWLKDLTIEGQIYRTECKKSHLEANRGHETGLQQAGFKVSIFPKEYSRFARVYSNGGRGPESEVVDVLAQKVHPAINLVYPIKFVPDAPVLNRLNLSDDLFIAHKPA